MRTSVPVPAVTRDSVSADSCTLLCSVDAAEETTLSWNRDEQIVNSSSSALPLPLTVQLQDFSSQYNCVAENPAERKSHALTVETLCSTDTTDVNNNNNYRHYIIPLTIVSIVISVPAVFIIIMKICFNYKRTTKQTQDLLTKVQYCLRQNQLSDAPPVDGALGHRLYDPSAATDCTDTSTVYTTLHQSSQTLQR